MRERIARTSPRVRARVAGAFYLLNILTGAVAAVSVRGRVAASLIATACYFAVTVLFYDLFRPVNRTVSLLAAFFSLVGCTLGVLSLHHLAPA